MAGNYGFVSPGGMANNAIEQFLMQREMQQRQQMLDEMNRQEQDERQRQSEQGLKLRLGDQDLQREQFDADQQDRTAQRTRLAEQDAIAATDRRGAQNQIGIRQMMAAGLQTGADPRAAQLQAFGEGVEIPMDVLDPERETRLEGERDALNHQQRLAEIAAQGAQSRLTVGMNNHRPDAYGERSQSRLGAAIDGLIPLISDQTVGTWRAKGARAVQGVTPGTSNPTVDFDAALGQIKALIGFNELNAMRQASPTGGALGQVSERELAYLQSVAGALDPNQSEAAFRAQLQKVRDEIQAVVEYGLGGQPGRGAGGGPGGGGAVRWGRDANGRPVRLP